LPEHHEGRDRADPEMTGERLLLVGVHLDEADVLVLFGRLLEGRRERLAGTAPGRPEVDDDDVVAGDGLVEAFGDQLGNGHAASSIKGSLYAFWCRRSGKSPPAAGAG